MKILVDAGSHTGESTRPMWPDFDKVYCWEPNLAFAHHYQGLRHVTLIAAVAGVENGVVPFYLGTDGKMQGSSIYPNKLTGDLSRVAIEVPSLRFAEWLPCIAKHHITLKMDIEGAEYAVLSDLLHSGTFRVLQRLLIEWHYEKVPHVTRERHDQTVRRVQRAIPSVEEWTG